MQKTDLQAAIDEGYTIRLDSDGIGEVEKDANTIYRVDLDKHPACHCADALFRNGGSYGGYCRHAWWIGQLSVCECGSEMVLEETEGFKFYSCVSCGNAKDAKLVKKVRAARRAASLRAA